ncbi:MAG: ribosomal protein [Actinomycetota bacterium]|jgi:small subunit ribosomal protein S18
MAKAAPKRGKNKDNARRSKKKISLLTQEKVEFVDYKDINMLRRFMSDRAKIRARRVSGNDSQQQKEIARAIKNAREMALLPYTNRVTTQRGGGRDRGERGDRGDRGDRGLKLENAEIRETVTDDAVIEELEATFIDAEGTEVEVVVEDVEVSE